MPTFKTLTRVKCLNAMVSLIRYQEKSQCCYSKRNQKGFRQFFSIIQLAIANASIALLEDKSPLKAIPACTYLKNI